jgi:hypothetical protein
VCKVACIQLFDVERGAVTTVPVLGAFDGRCSPCRASSVREHLGLPSASNQSKDVPCDRPLVLRAQRPVGDQGEEEIGEGRHAAHHRRRRHARVSPSLRVASSRARTLKNSNLLRYAFVSATLSHNAVRAG